jgi:hypothetical protein
MPGAMRVDEDPAAAVETLGLEGDAGRPGKA